MLELLKTADANSRQNVSKGITMSVVEDIANENNITFKRMSQYVHV